MSDANMLSPACHGSSNANIRVLEDKRLLGAYPEVVHCHDIYFRIRFATLDIVAGIYYIKITLQTKRRDGVGEVLAARSRCNGSFYAQVMECIYYVNKCVIRHQMLEVMWIIILFQFFNFADGLVVKNSHPAHKGIKPEAVA